MFKHEYITRHSSLIPSTAYDHKIVVVGAGAIGSFVVLALAKMGYNNIHVFDFDTVEPENISSQFYPTQSIGALKVLALSKMVMDFTGIEISQYPRKVEPSDLRGHIVISAVDKMDVRAAIFEAAECKWLIDPRMGAEYATMAVLDAQDTCSRENYAKSLFKDSEAVQERCTAKTTIYTVFLIAGQVVKAVKDLTCGPVRDNRISSLDWNINENAMLAFNHEGRRL